MRTRPRSDIAHTRLPVLLAASLLAATLLAACGDLPQPFAGNPGRNARRLAQPPPARLVVEPASAALLPNAGVTGFATALAEALVGREVPAVAAFGRAGEWRLVTTAELTAGQVLPSYAVRDPQGAAKGAVQGTPVPASEWQVASPAVLQREAAASAPAIAALLDRIEAQRQGSDPNSLVNRPTRVAVGSVTGAPGDGNTALAREMRSALAKRGAVMQERAQDADFVVAGQVRAVAEKPGITRIELQWIVTDAQGRDVGHTVQLNDVPDDAVGGLWGEVATAAVQAVADGVRDLILRQVERFGHDAALPPAS